MEFDVSSAEVSLELWFEEIDVGECEFKRYERRGFKVEMRKERRREKRVLTVWFVRDETFGFVLKKL